MGNVLKQGLSGFWAGFWPWGFVLGMTKGSVIGGSRAYLLRVCEDDFKMSKSTSDLVSGFGAGAVQGVFMSPILLARTRVNQSLTERAAAAGPKGKIQTGLLAEMKLSSQVLTNGVREEGWGVIAKGMPAMVFKRTLDWGSRFIIIGQYNQFFKSLKTTEDKKLNNMETLAASFLGGATSCALTMPLDRLMPILQQTRPDNESIVSFMKKSLQKEGLTTLQRGFLMRAMHTGYHTAFAVFVADKIYTLFN